MDIVKRIRTASYTADEAANEIEWLRGELETSATEIERLRDELQSIADVSERWTDSLVSQINEMAHKALKGKE